MKLSPAEGWVGRPQSRRPPPLLPPPASWPECPSPARVRLGPGTTEGGRASNLNLHAIAGQCIATEKQPGRRGRTGGVCPNTPRKARRGRCTFSLGCKPRKCIQPPSKTSARRACRKKTGVCPYNNTTGANQASYKHRSSRPTPNSVKYLNYVLYCRRKERLRCCAATCPHLIRGMNTFKPERVMAPRVPGVLEDTGRDVNGVLSNHTTCQPSFRIKRETEGGREREREREREYW